jgi:hypothetical protein
MNTTIIVAAASSIARKKRSKIRNLKKVEVPASSVSKEQSLKWVEEGKCQVCGGSSGEFKGICDGCRYD